MLFVCQMKKLGQRIKTFSSGWANSWLLEGQLVSCAPQNPWGAESTAWQLAPSELLLSKYMLEAPEFCAFGNITPFLFSVFPSWWPSCSLLSSSIKFLYLFIPTQSLAVVENGVTSWTPGTPGSRRISGIYSRYQLPMSSGLWLTGTDTETDTWGGLVPEGSKPSCWQKTHRRGASGHLFKPALPKACAQRRGSIDPEGQLCTQWAWETPNSLPSFWDFITHVNSS